jgi:hypothetical protein
VLAGDARRQKRCETAPISYGRQERRGSHVTLGSDCRKGTRKEAGRSESNGFQIAEGEVTRRGAFGSASFDSLRCRGCVASQPRHTRRVVPGNRKPEGTGRALAKRWTRGKSIERPTASVRLGASGVPTPGPARGLAQARPTNRALRTPSECTQSLIVCRSRHRSIGRFPREFGRR